MAHEMGQQGIVFCLCEHDTSKSFALSSEPCVSQQLAGIVCLASLQLAVEQINWAFEVRPSEKTACHEFSPLTLSAHTSSWPVLNTSQRNLTPRLFFHPLKEGAWSQANVCGHT